MGNEMPKVLMIHANPIHETDDATSQTLNSLFGGWEPKRLAQIICRHTPASGHQIYHLSSEEVVGVNLYHKIRRPRAKVNQEAASVPGLVDLGSEGAALALKNLVLTYAEVLPYRIGDGLNKFIKQFQPDVIYSLLGHYRIIKLVADLARIHSLPVVPHFMDDWISTRFAEQKIFHPIRGCINYTLKNLMMNVKEGLTISPAMAEEYMARFHIPMKPLMNCVNIPQYVQPTLPAGNDTRIITYAGGLHLYRWESALAVSQAVEAMRSKGENIEFHIYTSEANQSQHSPRFSGYAGTRMLPYVDTKSLGRIYGHSCMLVHLESFRPVASRYTRLSISTKIPEYMVAAKPILAVGPRGIASIEHILNTTSGVWAAAEAAKIEESIHGALSSEEDYQKLCHNAFRAAIQHHSSVSQQRTLQSVLTESMRQAPNQKMNGAVKTPIS